MIYPLPSISNFENFYLYGAGVVGLSYKRQLEGLKENKKIISYIETSPRTELFHDLPIIPLSDLPKSIPENTAVIIASINFKDEIAELLSTVGVPEFQIISPGESSFPARLPCDRSELCDVSNILLYPSVEDSDTLEMLNEKMRWYIPESCEASCSCISKSLKPSQKHHVTILNTFSKESMNEFDLILIWKEAQAYNIPIHMHSRTYLIDPNTLPPVEPRNLRSLSLVCSSQDKIDRCLNKSKERFEALIKFCQNAPSVTLVGNGPSGLAVLDNIDLQTHYIICNSAVKNTRLLEALHPKVIVFNDPVFYSGYKPYTKQFCNDLVEACLKHGIFALTGLDSGLLLLEHYPEIEPYLITIPVKRNAETKLSTFQKAFNIPQVDDFYVDDSWNILTLYMLPIAAALNDLTYLWGFDGRKPDEKYYWKHNQGLQYTDLMQEVIKAHPAFFKNVDKAEYYVRHCESLEAMLCHFEELNCEFINKTISYVPPLQKRCKI